MKTLRQWLGLCEHSWETIKEIEVFDFSFGEAKYPSYRKFIQRCNKCGSLKKFKA